MKVAEVSFTSPIKSCPLYVEKDFEYVFALLFENIEFYFKRKVNRNDKSHKNVRH
jgi:hypothetical protein